MATKQKFEADDTYHKVQPMYYGNHNYWLFQTYNEAKVFAEIVSGKANKNRIGTLTPVALAFPKNVKPVEFHINYSRRDAKYMVGANNTFPLDYANTIVDARLKAVALMKKHNLGMICIYQFDTFKSANTCRFKDIASIFLYRGHWEYADLVKHKNVYLNPQTGTVTRK